MVPAILECKLPCMRSRPYMHTRLMVACGDRILPLEAEVNQVSAGQQFGWESHVDCRQLPPHAFNLQRSQCTEEVRSNAQGPTFMARSHCHAPQSTGKYTMERQQPSCTDNDQLLLSTLARNPIEKLQHDQRNHGRNLMLWCTGAIGTWQRVVVGGIQFPVHA